ncbi:MAG: BMP family ABC transporter substrate-binding protein [Clostridiales bacterium]|nr:BMP family ABC transporter substrate-binding protein [Clostridiales bacterium]
MPYNTPQEHYLSALKMGKKDLPSGSSPEQPETLPALDTILENVEIRGEVPLGLIDIPSELIVGTKTRGRMTSFAPNFMPLLNDNSEFAMKWKSLCEAHLHEGIRDPIIAYEYLNRYYVLEGNKRVSVLKYFDAPTIPAYATRIIPAWEDTREIRIYYEFLDFYNETNINYVEFTKEGSFRKLCRLTGHRGRERWSMDDRINFRFCYNNFAEAFEELGGNKLSCTTGDALLSYMYVFGYDSMKNMSSADYKKNLKKVWEEIELNQDDEEPARKTDLKLDPTPDARKNLISQILTGSTGSSSKTIKIAFIHTKSTETSSWTYAHELGRMYVNDTFHGRIQTTAYENNATAADAQTAIEKAIADGNTIIFTTNPIFLSASIKAAVDHPEVKILNCSLNTNHKYIRTYYARMFEAKLLNGVLAGIMTDTNKIGYIADYPITSMPANINAFAIGVKMVNPKAKIYLEWSTLKENQGVDLTEKLYNMGATYISHLDMIVPQHATRRFGLYRVNGETPVNLALPVLDWGKYYERIIRNIIHGTWNTDGKTEGKKAISYFWGMSSGVVDVEWSPAIPAETRNLLETLKRAIMRYDFKPFSGVLHSQEGIIQSDPDSHMSLSDIIAMDWLADNVIGFIPAAKDLMPEVETQIVVRQEGVRKEEDSE